ncbi:MAG: hypothetical protein OXM55_02980 [Bdellovibrionales bacterium]|nr:hypothetical protein [Bdellovibrionales bacterium]
MNLTTYDECEKYLDFQPEKPWPNNWPPFSWENKLVSGFTHSYKNQYVLNFSSTDVNFLHLFHTCHPQLNFSELGRIILGWSNREKNICSWQEFFSLYGFHQNTESLVQQLKIFTSTPVSFQAWVNKKAIHLSELRILNSLEDMKQIHFIFEWIAEQSPSHSQGIKILELGVELFLMSLDPDKILKSYFSPEKVIQEMEKKRNPLSSSQDQVNKNNLKKVIWPSQVSTQWQRRGDTTGLEIKIWCRNQKEWEEKIHRVNQLSVFNRLDRTDPI